MPTTVTSRRRPTNSKPRKGFVFKSLIIFIIFVALTISQLYLAIQFENISKFFKDNILLSIGFFCLALFHVLIYVFVENVRIIKIVNWLVGFFIVECIILSIAMTMLNFLFCQLFGSTLIALFLVFLFYIIAAFINHDLTLDVVILFVLVYIFLIGAIFFLSLYTISKLEFTIYICLAIIMMIVCMFIMYHAQCIIGGRYAIIRVSDYILASLILYMDFLLLLMILLNFVPQIVDATAKALK